MKLHTTILVTLLLLSISAYTAKAVRVSDGDTITVLTDNKAQIQIRLEGMDKVEMPDDSQKPDLYIGYLKIPQADPLPKELFFCYRTKKS